MVSEDENALLNYMRTGDDLGEKCFVFQGFMLTKRSILAAQFKEPEY